MAATTNQADTTLSAPHHIKATLPGRPASPIQAEAGRMRCEDGEHQGEEWVTRRPGGAEGTPAPLLDNNNKSEQHTEQAGNCDAAPAGFRNRKSRSRGRLFFYLKSGLAYHQGEALRFLTVTSADESPKDLTYSFKRLVQEIRRVTPQSLINQEWLTLRQAARYYAGKPADEPLTIEYCGCRTNEGNGVIHALILGDFIPWKWLQETWKRIHQAFHINIQKVPQGGNAEKVTSYILGQYIANQDGFIRMVVSSGWLYPGVRAEFKALVQEKQKALGYAEGFKAATEEWTMRMYGARHQEAHRKGWRRLAGNDLDNQEKRLRKAHRAAMKGRYRYIPTESEEQIVTRLKRASRR